MGNRKYGIQQMNTEEALETILDDANIKGSDLGITSEQQVYNIINNKVIVR